MPDTDEQLLAYIATGDTAAFDQLYARYRDAVYNHLCYLEPSRRSTDDLFQEVWLRVVQHAGRQRVRHFRAWLFTIVANVHHDALRKARMRRLLSPLLSPRERATTEDTAIDIRNDLARALEKLSPRQRQVFLLKEIEDFRHEDIARMLGISVGTSKSSLFQAMQVLRRELQSYRKK